MGHRSVVIRGFLVRRGQVDEDSRDSRVKPVSLTGFRNWFPAPGREAEGRAMLRHLGQKQGRGALRKEVRHTLLRAVTLSFAELLFSLVIHVHLLATPWPEAHQASLSVTISPSLLTLMAIEPVRPSNHLTLCRPLLLVELWIPCSPRCHEGLGCRVCEDPAHATEGVGG